MSDSRNIDLNDIAPTLDDFKNSGWKEALGPPEERRYSLMHHHLETAARIAFDDGQPARGKALWLLSGACSMMLEPECRNDPFKPIYKEFPSGRHSVTPDDFLRSDLEFFALIVDEADDPRLKARLADILWLTSAPRRDPKTALTAIDSYRSIPLDFDNWRRDGKECWHRALVLAFMQGSGGDRVANMEKAIVKAIESVEWPNSFFCVELADFLKSLNLGKKHTLKIAEKLESFVTKASLSSTIANQYWTAAEWLSAAGENARSASALVKMAECYVKDGDAYASGGGRGHASATEFYLRAIQIYKNIPGKERAAHQVDERIDALRKKHEESRTKIADHMSPISVSTPANDLIEIIEESRKAVSGKKPVEALAALAQLHQIVNVKELRESAVEMMKKHPTRTFLGNTHRSRDGRILGHQPGTNPFAEMSEKAVYFQMIEQHMLSMSLAVRGIFIPALDVLRQEHRFREVDFIDIARQSPFAPPGRETLFGKALFAGYDYDFATAIHLLAPQIENMVRFHLKQNSAQTTHLDKNEKIEDEVSLKSLMERPEAVQIFGENLSFEIRALFCERVGPNLRNLVAHGLLDDASSHQSVYPVYAWWLALRLAFTSFLDALMEDFDEDSLHKEIDAGPPVGREAW